MKSDIRSDLSSDRRRSQTAPTGALRCNHGIRREPGDEGLRSPRSEESIHHQTVPARRPPPLACQVGFDRGFINEYNAFGLNRYGWNTMPEPVFALFLYLGAVSFGGDQ